MKHTFIYNKANRTKNESGITRSRTHLFNIVKPYSVVKRMAVIIMTAIMIICQTGCGTSGSNGAIVPGSSITPAKKKGNVTDIAKNSDNATLVGIVSSIDTTLKNIHFIDVETGTEYSVMYTGGTDIQDAYGKLKAATLIQPGEIYDVYCNKYGKATKIYGSKNAWSRTSVTDIELDESSKSVVIGQTTLNYRDYTVVTSGGNLISIAQIVKEDELTLRGIDDKLYSISVDNGHGYLELTGIDAFVGGYVTLGSSLLYGVTQDMMLTVGVGTYDVELQSADMTATKKVTIKKDATSTLDFSEYKQLSAKKGAINFSVTPENAIMAIDGSEVDYSKPVSLTYGSHTARSLRRCSSSAACRGRNRASGRAGCCDCIPCRMSGGPAGTGTCASGRYTARPPQACCRMFCRRRPDFCPFRSSFPSARPDKRRTLLFCGVGSA